MKPISEIVKEKPWLGWILFISTLLIVFLLGLLASSISERRAEALFTNTPLIKINSLEPNSAIWGKNYPHEYNSYLKTADTSFKSLYNGNKKTDMLAQYPDYVILWAGYAFSKEYNQPRGHFYAITDVINILRTGAPQNENDGPQPNTCWTCKSPDVPRMMNKIGIADFYKGKWASMGKEITNPIGCADCHDEKTMSLKITRPALIEAFQRQGKDINKSTHQEMRSLVCAQCHVEYYFKKEGAYLTFPWDKGFSVEDIEKYYDEYKFSDWQHSLSKAPMLKAQHPDYELFTTGIHYQRGLACADCHMPYINEGGQKFSSHWKQSPLNSISNTCLVCHRESEETLRNNVYEIQKKVQQIKTELEGLLVKAHFEAKAAWDAGANDNEMNEALQLIRQSQWRWDFVAASHGGSFHSPLETARIIANGIIKAQQARLLLTKVLFAHNITKPVKIPDISTKEKAQKYIGLDIEKLNKEKQEFLNNLAKKWKS